MKLLVLGGTKFLGRHLVETALAAGHRITLFHRGRTNPGLFPEVEHVAGDRDGGLGALDGRRWDAAVDTCGYFPRLVGASARFLAGKVEHYTFVSSISVYAGFAPGMDETAPVGTIDDPAVEEITETSYGPLKALCERAAEEAMPGRVLNARAGLIVGPYDASDRFTYWVRRISMGGRVLVPGPRDRPVQVIHAADMAAWFLKMASEGRGGVYNVTGPPAPGTMEDLFRTCVEASGSNAAAEWVDEPFLEAHRAGWWVELPLCVPASESGVLSVDVSRAAAAGLVQRPLLTAVRETLAWDATRPPGTELKAGLTAAREAELLAGWDAKRGG